MSTLNDKLQEMTAEDVANIYKRIFSTPDGQLMIEDLRNRWYIKIPTTGRGNDQTNFNEGMRSVVLHIESQIEFIPELLNNIPEGN